ncbi:MAG: SDR family NAD(P)-dependent oxidoreductase [Anaerolineae bacterium]|nr:SDR family NAD(P)-dependent oxidoreductase [Anaerolineae bacterium]
MGIHYIPAVLITGASSGIGRACANYLHQRGYCVYGTSRNPASYPGTPFELIAMDVTDESSVQQAVATIMESAGSIDVVVNNAGSGIVGAIEETSIEEAQSQMETNFFGVLRVCRAVLPIMRQQQSGLIINVSSIGGVVGIPFQGLYSASKFAIEGLTEALRMEVRPFGIRVAMIEPGDFRTGFTANRRPTHESTQSTVYTERCAKALAVMEADEQNGLPPEKVARLIERIIRARNPRLRWVAGPFFEQMLPLIKRFAPSSVVEWGIRKYYQVE